MDSITECIDVGKTFAKCFLSLFDSYRITAGWLFGRGGERFDKISLLISLNFLSVTAKQYTLQTGLIFQHVTANDMSCGVSEFT